jgi:hypothetical protein
MWEWGHEMGVMGMGVGERKISMGRGRMEKGMWGGEMSMGKGNMGRETW